MAQETITVAKKEFEQMRQELELLRGSRIYQRLLEFEENISKGKKFSRSDLGFLPHQRTKPIIST